MGRAPAGAVVRAFASGKLVFRSDWYLEFMQGTRCYVRSDRGEYVEAVLVRKAAKSDSYNVVVSVGGRDLTLRYSKLRFSVMPESSAAAALMLLKSGIAVKTRYRCRKKV